MDDLIKKILSKETLLLALLTGSSYFFAYLFEFGYSQYFNYPHEFISINLENIIYAFIAFLVITFFTALFFIVSSFITIIAKEIKNNLIFNEENHIFKVNDLKDKKIKKFIQN